MNKFILLLVIALSITSISLSGDFTLNVTYTRGEKSKDTRSETEIYFVTFGEIRYEKEFYGKTLPDELAEFKRCKIGEVTLNKITELAAKHSINSNETFYMDPKGIDDFGTYINLDITLVMNGESYKISLSGDATHVMDTKAYRNSIEFIKEIRKIAKEC
ncbi:MAG: hypothetical protein IT281_08515 [Ignavibacteria bacterium]|nr:hypothetical protein [Ignavibacteria bacterium]MCC7159566.1 hypothetical protein [Ignavibacteria bacterium]